MLILNSPVDPTLSLYDDIRGRFWCGNISSLTTLEEVSSVWKYLVSALETSQVGLQTSLDVKDIKAGLSCKRPNRVCHVNHSLTRAKEERKGGRLFP